MGMRSYAGERSLRPILNLASLAGFVFLLSACADSAPVRPQLPQLPSRFAAQSATATLGAPSEPTPKAWWRVFRDADLDALEAEGLERAPDARIAMARLKEAIAIRAEALSDYAPQGNLSGQASDQHTRTAYSGLNTNTSTLPPSLSGLETLFLPAPETKSLAASFNVSWELDLFGRQKAARRGARADLWAARFDYEASQLALAANIANSLFQVRSLLAQLDDARETERISKELDAVGQRKYAHGLAAGSDAARLDSDLATAQAEVVRLKTAVDVAKRALLALVGRGTAPVAELHLDAKLNPPPPPPAGAPSDLLLRRPDVREAEQRLRSGVADMTLARLALYPTFNLTPSGSLSRQDANYLATSSVWTLAAGALVPVLDRPRLLAATRQKKARAEELAALYEQAVQNAYRDAESGLAQMATDQDRLRLLSQAEASAHLAFDASERAYALGLVDLTSLLDVERAWRLSRTALTSAQTLALSNALTTIKALGGGWDGQGGLSNDGSHGMASPKEKA